MGSHKIVEREGGHLVVCLGGSSERRVYKVFLQNGGQEEAEVEVEVEVETGVAEVEVGIEDEGVPDTIAVVVLVDEAVVEGGGTADLGFQVFDREGGNTIHAEVASDVEGIGLEVGHSVREEVAERWVEGEWNVV